MGKNETGSPGTSASLGITYLEHHLSHGLWSLMFPLLYPPLSSTTSNDCGFFFFFLIDFIYLFTGCIWSLLPCAGIKWGLLFIAVLRLLIAVASLAVEHRL